MVTDLAVMGNMGVSHQVIIVTQAGMTAALGSTTVDGSEFPDDIVIPDVDKSIFTLESDILGIGAQGRERKNQAFLTDNRVFVNGGVVLNHSAVANAHTGTDNHVGIHLDILP